MYSEFALKNYLPAEDYKLWLLFVKACRILTAPVITINSLSEAHSSLMQFCKKFELMYRQQEVTPNMHLHSHLINCVLDYGPVHNVWLFSFERFNGLLGDFKTNQKSPVILCRLDFWLISNNLCDSVNSTEIIPAIRTDHAAISLSLGEIGEVKGPGMWKMNVSLLDDEEYLNYLSVNIPKWKSEGERELSDKRSVWDWIKYNIRMHAIRYSKEKAKQKNDKEKMIQREYEEATRHFEKDPR